MLQVKKSETEEYHQLQFCQVETLANRTALQVLQEKELPILVTYGLNTLESYKKQTPVGLLTKTLLEAYPTELYLKRLLTWKVSAMSAKHLLFQLLPLVRGIYGNEYLSLPTPTATDYKGGANSESIRTGRKNRKEQSTRLYQTYPCDTNSQSEPQKDSEINPIREKWNTWKDIARQLGGTVPRNYWTLSEPPIPGVDDGIPDRMERSKSLGNAVCPYQAYPIFQAIHNIETAM